MRDRGYAPVNTLTRDPFLLRHKIWIPADPGELVSGIVAAVSAPLRSLTWGDAREVDFLVFERDI